MGEKAQKVKTDNSFLELFTSSLLELLKAGITVDKAMLFMSQGIKKYKIIIDNIYSEIRKGAGLSKALKTTELFPQNYIEMIKVGEESGNLEGVLSLILESIKESNELKSNIISASVYSAFVLGVVLVSFLVIEIYVVPKFKVIFSITGAKIPLITKILLASSDYVGYIFYAIAIALLLILVVLNFMLKKMRQKESSMSL